METYIKLIFIFVSLNFHYNFHITPKPSNTKQYDNYQYNYYILFKYTDQHPSLTLHLLTIDLYCGRNGCGYFSNKYLSGYDEIPIVIIKEVKSEVLAHLINSSLVSSTLPGHLKVAKYVLIHTKNYEHDLSNFRQFSILLTISKI